MIDRALCNLMIMQLRGALRRMARGGKSPIRVIGMILGVLVFIGWITLVSIGPVKKQQADPERVRTVMPLAVLAICLVSALTSAGDKAIAFTPGEVDQLFPGPFARRELLAYKLIKSGVGAVLTALMLSILMTTYSRWWPARFIAIFETLLLIQYLSISMLLAGQAIGTAAHSRARRLILFAALALLVVVGRVWVRTGANNGWAALYQLRDEPLGHIMLAPFEPLGQLMTATDWPALAKWGALATVLNLGLALIVFTLDAHYVEVAMTASQRRYEKLQRVRAGRFLSIGVASTSGWKLPMFPWWGGVGPIAWRQLTNAARSSRGLLMLLLIVAIGAAPMLSGSQFGQAWFNMLAAWVTFLCASMFTFDFRGDLELIETMKAAPLSAWAVVTGQLVAPVILLSLLHVVLLAGAATLLPHYRTWVIALLPAVVPFNFILFSIENLIFLIFPSRPAAVSPGDFQVLGRKSLFLVVRLIVLGILLGLASTIGVIVFTLLGRFPLAATTSASIVLCGFAAAFVPLLAWAYRRFDPSMDNPG